MKRTGDALQFERRARTALLRMAGITALTAWVCLFFLAPAGSGLAAKAPAEKPQAAAPGRAAVASDGLRLVFELRSDGIDWVSLYDVGAGREMLAGGRPFWRILVEDAAGRRHNLDNRSGWLRVSILSGQGWISLIWQRPKVLQSDGLEVRCDVTVVKARSTWSLSVENSTSATLREVAFPTVVTRPLGGDGRDDAVVFPRGPGELHADPFAKPVRYKSDYPTGWGSYQFMAHYDRAGGAYIATHDPLASTKKLETRTLDGGKALLLSFIWPVADATVAGNDFKMPGPAVVQCFRGDWFDAARIYRDWVRKKARWWPRDEMRRDTARWMHETAVWALAAGTTASVVGRVRDFAAYMGVPTAVHWYRWHEIPFDDNYPHYFPAKRDFREGVKELQTAGVRVMPYINGRLWDTDLEDFAKRARPFATKDERGEPYIEQYGSGQKLAPMCPTTPLWQKTVRQTVLRLLGPQYGVDAVYIDQVAAAAPRLCFDRSHGHPLGGGHWWTTLGYWPMLERLRAEMKKRYSEAAITTECNAEPYVHLFDGYLTWHFQHNGQVPVFPAIYGGRIQMFGRAYRGGPTKDLALRMKAAQSLVFGEQIGWISPDVIKEKDNGPFIRRMARLRYALRDYLADGEMARPPTIEGKIPDVTADWRWSGRWPVTDRAVQVGAWRARDGRLALLFVNVTSGTLAFDLLFDGEDYGLKSGTLRLTPRTELGPRRSDVVPGNFRRRVRLAPFEVLVFEIAETAERDTGKPPVEKRRR